MIRAPEERGELAENAFVGANSNPARSERWLGCGVICRTSEVSKPPSAIYSPLCSLSTSFPRFTIFPLAVVKLQLTNASLCPQAFKVTQRRNNDSLSKFPHLANFDRSPRIAFAPGHEQDSRNPLGAPRDQ